MLPPEAAVLRILTKPGIKMMLGQLLVAKLYCVKICISLSLLVCRDHFDFSIIQGE